MAKERSTAFYILTAAVLLAVAAVAVVLLQRRAEAPPEPEVLMAEQKAYLAEIVVADPRMSAAENFLGDTVVYLDAQVTNRGARAVRHVEIELEFVDFYQQVVLREKATPVTPRAPPLKPGETRAFRISFEHLPADWNQALPRVTPVSVSF